jgi:hypothetical protein
MHKLRANSLPGNASSCSCVRPRSLLATAVAALGHNLQDQLARLFAPVACADNLDGFVLGLVAGDLDLGAGLLAEVVDGATTGSDDKPDDC